MKKQTKTLFLLPLFALLMTACTPGGGDTPSEAIYPTAVEVTGLTTVKEGETSQLNISFLPAETTVKDVLWSSSNNNYATVSSVGLVSAIKEGTCNIIATYRIAAQEFASETINFTVLPADEPETYPTSASISGQSNLYVGNTTQLSLTYNPSTASVKEATWSSNNTSVATVNAGNGLVTAKGKGSATITATYKTSVNTNKEAKFTISVSEQVTPEETTWTKISDINTLIAGDVVVIANSAKSTVAGSMKSSSQGAKYLSSVSATFNNDTIVNLPEAALQFTVGGSTGAWTFTNENGQKLSAIGSSRNQKLGWDEGVTTWTITCDSIGLMTITNTEYTYGTIYFNSGTPRFTTYTNASSGMLTPELYRGKAAEPVDPTGISMNSSVEIAQGASKTLSVTYEPSNANQNKDLTWTSSNTNVATVRNGLVTVKAGAAIGATAVITAKLTNLPKLPAATCTVTVVEQQLDAWTIMIYMCGSDLESGSGYATADIKEILNVSNQPDDVNIIIETGGAKSWKSTYGIKASELGRWHVENKQLVKDASLTKADMSKTSTFQSFLEWGLTSYPAERTGVILWNHGGAMQGVCFDDNYNDGYGSLLASEVSDALTGAFSKIGRSEKLEWIGYDACLMAVQDIAEKNSHFFNYMIASQETEAGDGWDYDGGWLKEIYNNPSGIDSKQVITSICTTFVADNSREATLSALDLSKMSTYKSAWESVAGSLNVKSSSDWNTLKSLCDSCKKFGYYSGYGYVYDIFDAKDFISKGKNTYPNANWSALDTAFNSLIVANKTTSDYSDAHGLCFFAAISGYSSDTDYAASETNFTVWRNINVQYGSWYQ